MTETRRSCRGRAGVGAADPFHSNAYYAADGRMVTATRQTARARGRRPPPPPRPPPTALGLLHHVAVSQHVDVDVAADDVLTLPVLLEAAHGRLSLRVARDPGDRAVAQV